MARFAVVYLKVVIHLLLAFPLVWLGCRVIRQDLGPDPAEELVKQLGFNGACILWLSLSMTPLRAFTGWSGWIGFRRLLGVWSFLYICLHLLVFIVAWAGLDVDVLAEEITQRPYIIIGFAAWLGLVPLVITSTQKARRRMGRSWQKLHKLVYLVSMLVLLHIIWIAKLDYLQSGLFGLVLSILFLARIKLKNKKSI